MRQITIKEDKLTGNDITEIDIENSTYLEKEEKNQLIYIKQKFPSLMMKFRN